MIASSEIHAVVYDGTDVVITTTVGPLSRTRRFASEEAAQAFLDQFEDILLTGWIPRALRPLF